MNLTEEQISLLSELVGEFGEQATSKQILGYIEKKNLPVPYFIIRDESRKISRGVFKLTTKVKPKDIKKDDHVTQIASKRTINITESFVPDVLSTYVPFGFYRDLKDIVKSKIFYPVYITGHSGNGKTLMVEQVCASLSRELIRVNITKRTDENDLIGSYELIDGNTVRREGPVITAMRRGAVLLLDEVDLGTEDLLCLQPILEGKPYFDKKTGEIITPFYGFNIIATANTKGKGDYDGRYLGTNIMNEAMLERFAMTEEQDYPSEKEEIKILDKNMKELGIEDDKFIKHLVEWAGLIRKSFKDGAVNEIISTRRLVHIIKAYKIFDGDRLKAVEKCLNRFDTETKTSFLDFYSKIDTKESETITNNSTIFSTLASKLSERYKTSICIDYNNPEDVIIVSAFGRKTAISSQILSKLAPQEIESHISEIVEKHDFLKPASQIQF